MTSHMISEWIVTLCGAAVLSTGLVAGVFLAFSDFVMKSLNAASPEVGIEAMQLINRKVYGSLFLALFLGMAPVALFLAVYAFVFLSSAAAAWIISGGLIYVFGSFAVTLVCNVPMNKRLDAMDHSSDEAAAYWQIYYSKWTAWNHVRTVASAVSMGCFFVGFLVLGA
jgi:uncharacterized membrane protein